MVSAPRGAERFADRELLLVIGADFLHKNRLFALRVAMELRAAHGWRGVLALVGPKVYSGSSMGEESEYCLRHPDLVDSVMRIPSVTAGEKAWLYERAAMVIYPTTVEGFGLVPFEAAAAGRPCLYSAQGALREALPPEEAHIVGWDPVATACAANMLLRDAGAREQHVAALRRAAELYKWDASARRLVKIYSDTLNRAPRSTFAEGLYNPNMTRLAGHLVGRQGLPEETQRTLWAISRRPGMAKPFFGALRAAHRVGRWVGRQHRVDEVLPSMD